MFELEIMVTGYTLVVATTTAVISKCINKKKLNKINEELRISKSNLLKAESEIKEIKMVLESTTQIKTDPI